MTNISSVTSGSMTREVIAGPPAAPQSDQPQRGLMRRALTPAYPPKQYRKLIAPDTTQEATSISKRAVTISAQSPRSWLRQSK